MFEAFGLVAGAIALAVISLLILVAVNGDDFTVPTFLTAGLLAVFTFFNGFSNTVSLITGNWVYLIIGAICYLSAGVLWSFFKWDRYIKGEVERLKKNWDYQTSKSEYQKSPIFENTFEKYAEDNLTVASERKSAIATWIMFFPVSMVLYVIGDFLREFVNWVVKYFGKVYTAITNRHVNKYK